MSRATLMASISAQIAALDDHLASIQPTTVGADGATVSNPDWIALSNHRMKLESHLARLENGKTFVRGRITGI